MAEEVIRFRFYSRDKSFAEVVGRALGPGYEIRHHDLDSAGSMVHARQHADAVLLDTSSVGPEGYEDILRLMYVLQKSSRPPPPIVVMVHEDQQDAVRTFIENGAYETLASPPDIPGLRVVLRRARRYHQIETNLFQSRSRPQTSRKTVRQTNKTSLTPRLARAGRVFLARQRAGTGKRCSTRCRAGRRANHRTPAPAQSNSQWLCPTLGIEPL